MISKEKAQFRDTERNKNWMCGYLEIFKMLWRGWIEVNKELNLIISRKVISDESLYVIGRST